MAKENYPNCLYLNIKQNYFDEIIAGTKTKEYREVKPTTIKKLLQVDARGFEVQDEKGNSLPIKYDYIHFRVGMAKVADDAIVKVVNAYSEVIVDENGMPYEYVTNEKGKILFEDADGKVFPESDIEKIDATFKTDEEADAYFANVHQAKPKFDEEGNCTNGLYWVVQQVVFELGEIVEKSIVSKK